MVDSIPDMTAQELKDRHFSVDGTPLSDTALDTHIRAATNLIDTRVPIAEYDTSEHLQDVLGYLAAHFAASEDPTEKQEDMGDSSFRYESYVGEGLEETRYGRRALELDHTGALAESPGETSEWFSIGVEGDLGPEF
jgi:hypothetical protein